MSAQIVKTLPAKPAVKVTYDCLAPATEPTLKRLPGPFPFQKTTTADLQWAVAFIEHSNGLIKDSEKAFDELTRKEKAARDTIGQRDTEIEKLKERNGQNDKRIRVLEADNARQAKLNHKLEHELQSARDEAKKAKNQLTKELKEALKKLTKAEANIESLKAKLCEADAAAAEAWIRERLSDVEDHKAIDLLQKALDKECKENEGLKTDLHAKDQQLRETEQDLQKSKDAEAHSQDEIKRLNELIAKLESQICDKDRQLRRYESDIKQLKQQRDELIAKEAQLSKALASKTAEHEQTVADLVKAHEKIAGLECKVAEQAKEIQTAHEHVKREHAKHVQDIKDKDAEIAKHTQAINELRCHLAELGVTLALITKERDQAKSDDAVDKEKLRRAVEERDAARKQRDTANRERDQAQSDDATDKEKVRQALNERDAANRERDAANQERDQAKSDDNADKEKIRQAVEERDQARKDDATDKRDINRLTRERNEARNNDTNDHATIAELEQRLNEALQKAKEASDAAQQSKQNDAADKAAIEAEKKRAEAAEAKQKAAEEAASKAKEEHDKECARQPVLDNDVKLANPIAVVGSLSGAPRNVDDETFNINCPFPVKLFNHASNKIYVSTNGLLTLDHPSDIYHYQKLPYLPYFSQGLPDYTLAPFWADLYIYKNTPQGIYYEVTGEAGKRKLEIEWYVSRYGNSAQYYHFSVILEEAKPNFATFQYYDARDKGAKCTIGVQGLKTGLMFSHDQEKALPGVQVAFDTGKNTFTPSTFNVEASKAAKSTKAKGDAKPTAAVTATVSEVAEIY